MTLKRPVTLAAARRWPAAAARRESFCARMGGMREKLTSDRTARDPRSKINRALAAWDCDEPELLQPHHVTKGVRPMRITKKMVGAEAWKNPARPARKGWRVTVYDESDAPVESTFDTEEQGALLYAKGKADANKAGEVLRVTPKAQKLAYWFDGSGIHPAGSYGDRPIYQTRRAMLRSNPRKPTVSRKISQLVREGYPQRQAVAIALSEQRAGKVRANPAAPARQKMLNISWLTAGGARETMSVPVEFVFNETIAGVKKRFFARLEGGMLIVSEYDTGGKVGQVPFTMRSAALDDRKAAKLFVQRMVEQVGPARFLAAIDRFSKIN